MERHIVLKAKAKKENESFKCSYCSTDKKFASKHYVGSKKHLLGQK